MVSVLLSAMCNELVFSYPQGRGDTYSRYPPGYLGVDTFGLGRSRQNCAENRAEIEGAMEQDDAKRVNVYGGKSQRRKPCHS